MAENKKMRYSDAELAWIKGAFGTEDEFGFHLIRKIFFPELDLKANLGQQINLYSTIPTEGRSAEDIAVDLKAMNLLMSHIERQLQVIKILAGTKEESVEQTKARLLKDSAK
jgi:hypothetical protein